MKRAKIISHKFFKCRAREVTWLLELGHWDEYVSNRVSSWAMLLFGTKSLPGYPAITSIKQYRTSFGNTCINIYTILKQMSK